MLAKFIALAQFVSDGCQLSVVGVVQSGAAAGAVGNLFRLVGGVVAVFGAVLLRVGHRQQQAFVIVVDVNCKNGLLSPQNFFRNKCIQFNPSIF